MTKYIKHMHIVVWLTYGTYIPLSILLRVHSFSLPAIGSKIAILSDDKVESTPESIAGTFGATGQSNEMALGSKDALEKRVTAKKHKIEKYDNIVSPIKSIRKTCHSKNYCYRNIKQHTDKQHKFISKAYGFKKI